MFIDFLTLMLINMTAGLVLLAWYVYRGLDDPDQAKWAPAFAVPGLVALLCGLRMAWVWPLPGVYNAAFGDTSVLLGVLFAGAAWSIATKRDLMPLCVYAFFAGVAGVLVGVRIIDLHLTLQPILSGVGFILTGSAGVFAGFTLWQRRSKLIRATGSVVLVVAAAIWALTGYLGYWGHLAMFDKWVPK